MKTYDGSPAAKAAIQDRDILLKVGNIPALGIVTWLEL